MTAAMGDKELSARSPVGEEAQLVAHMAAKLSHSLYHNPLQIIRRDIFDFFNLILKLSSKKP